MSAAVLALTSVLACSEPDAGPEQAQWGEHCYTEVLPTETAEDAPGACAWGLACNFSAGGGICLDKCCEDFDCRPVEGFDTFCDGIHCQITCGPAGECPQDLPAGPMVCLELTNYCEIAQS